MPCNLIRLFFPFNVGTKSTNSGNSACSLKLVYELFLQDLNKIIYISLLSYCIKACKVAS